MAPPDRSLIPLSLEQSFQFPLLKDQPLLPPIYLQVSFHFVHRDFLLDEG